MKTSKAFEAIKQIIIAAQLDRQGFHTIRTLESAAKELEATIEQIAAETVQDILRKKGLIASEGGALDAEETRRPDDSGTV